MEHLCWAAEAKLTFTEEKTQDEGRDEKTNETVCERRVARVEKGKESKDFVTGVSQQMEGMMCCNQIQEKRH